MARQVLAIFFLRIDPFSFFSWGLGVDYDFLPIFFPGVPDPYFPSCLVLVSPPPTGFAGRQTPPPPSFGRGFFIFSSPPLPWSLDLVFLFARFFFFSSLFPVLSPSFSPTLIEHHSFFLIQDPGSDRVLLFFSLFLPFAGLFHTVFHFDGAIFSPCPFGIGPPSSLPSPIPGFFFLFYRPRPLPRCSPFLRAALISFPFLPPLPLVFFFFF